MKTYLKARRSPPRATAIAASSASNAPLPGPSVCRNNSNNPCCNGNNRALSQPLWEISPRTGRDTNSGVPGRPLRTYAEFQCRIGNGTTLTPTGGVLQVTILDDLPDNDPITWNNNVFADGCTGRIQGVETVVKRGTFTNVIDKDPDANIPNQVKDPSVNWSNFICDRLVTQDNVRAWVVADLGGNTAHVSATWTQPSATSDVDGFIDPAPSPTAGTKYSIVRFTRARLGDGVVGAYFNTPLPGPASVGVLEPGGLLFQRFTFSNPDALQVTLPRVTLSDQTIVGFTDVVFDYPRIDVVADSFNTIFGDVCFRGALWVGAGASIYLLAGLTRTRDDGNYQYPGAMQLLKGGVVLADLDPTFYGEGAGAAPADIQVFGDAFFGSFNSWNSIHGVVLYNGGQVRQEPFSPLFAESDYNPYWGNNNNSLILIYPGGKWTIEQLLNAPSAPRVPAIVMSSGPGGPAVYLNYGTDGDGQTDYGHAWKASTATFSPKTPTTWANLLVPVDAGFQYLDFTNGAGERYLEAQMVNPGTSSGLYFEAVILPASLLAARQSSQQSGSKRPSASRSSIKPPRRLAP